MSFMNFVESYDLCVTIPQFMILFLFPDSE